METWTRTTYPLRQDGTRKKVLLNCIGYAQREADLQGVKYYTTINELVNGPGWFLTDDGYVVYCYKVVLRISKKEMMYDLYRFQTDIGCINYAIKNHLPKFQPKVSFTVFKAGGWRPIGTKNDYIEKFSTRRLRLFAKAYATYIMNGRKVNWELLGMIAAPSDHNFTLKAKKIIRYWKVERMIDEEFKKQLETNGVTMKGAIDKMEEAYAVAKSKKDAQTMVRVAENYIDIFKKSGKSDNGGMPELEGPGIMQALETAERQLNNLPEPTTDDKLKAALVQYEEVSGETTQDELLREANRLLIKPEVK